MRSPVYVMKVSPQPVTQLMPTHAERRKRMRNAVSADRKLHESKVKDAITRGPFDLKPSYAALRDNMSMQTLIGLVAGAVTVHDVCDALIDPENRGIESHGTKHGYDIGRPDHFNAASCAAIIQAASQLERDTDMNLSEIIDLIDHVTFHTGTLDHHQGSHALH